MSTIRYTHLRNTTPHFRPVKDCFTPSGSQLFSRSLTFNTKGGATVAWLYDDEKKQVVYNVSGCSMKDNFCRRIGRAIASGRLLTGKDTKVVDYKNVTDKGQAPSYKEINEYFFRTIQL
jgi:hypothetical protein